MIDRRWLFVCALYACAFVPVDQGRAQTRSVCASGDSAAEIVAVHGRVTLQDVAGQIQGVIAGGILCPGDRITTADGSGIDIRFASKDTITNVLSNSLVVLPDNQDSADISLQSGLLRFISSVRGAFLVRTPHTDAGIDGTEAMLVVDGAAVDTLVLVREGIVTARDRRDTDIAIALIAGAASYSSVSQPLVVATAENVPAKFRQFLLNPEGAADWAVYYPPILLGSGIDDPAIQQAAKLLDDGQPDQAEAVLTQYSGPQAAAAKALGAVAAVFRNRIQDGQELAAEAVRLQPDLAAAHIAQSYALQAGGQVTAARDAADRGVQSATSGPYAWARLAELELTLGNRSAAIDAAQTSLDMGATALGHSVLGFAQLATSDSSAAEMSFKAAIAVDAEAPLPRLGLGLALINGGELAAGRLELETAAALDPQRAQLRGWLGRAYLEEGLADKALAQFRLAQEQDPDDPTAWLFEAEERFAANQPVAAIKALETASAKTEGRATVRGRQGLGEDEAAQSAAAGRAFDSVGFEDQAVQSAARAVQASPTNPGAHRLLADLYRARPGFEISQSSERLVSQLLSGPTNDPIQPQLGEADLSLLDTAGAARVSFHEFNPLIQSDGFRVQASGLWGTQQTWSDEVSLTLKDGNYSVGVGQFHYQTNGFAINNGVKHDIVSVEIRGEPTPGLTFFTEVKGRETTRGDRTISFGGGTDPTAVSEDTRRSFRIGAHAELTENVDLLVAGTLAQFTALDSSSNTDITGITAVFTSDQQSNGGDLQAQLIGQFDDLTVQTGGAVVILNDGGAINSDTLVPSFFFGGFCFPPFVTDGANCRLTTVTSIDTFDRFFSGYVYGTYSPIDELDITLGASIEHLETDFFARTSINPKAAIIVKPADGVVLRAATSRTLKRPFILDQVIEPTTLGGFNQFFDDEDGTEAQLYAAGFDLSPFEGLWFGGEVVFRDLSTPLPLFGTTRAVDFGGEEWRYRGYANFAFGGGVAVAAGVEHTEAQSDVTGRAEALRTTRAPLTLSYFDESGLFASGTATYIKQRVLDRSLGLGPMIGEDQGIIFDASVGFRLPNKRGVISLEVQNITDQTINFADQTTFSNRPLTPAFARERTIMGQFSISLE